MEFSTRVNIEESDVKIDHNSKVFLIGSCFSANIGEKLKTYKFPVLYNPFGVLYNPVSIRQNLEILIKRRKLETNDLFFHNDLWNSFYHHTSFSNPDKKIGLENINKNIFKAREFLKQTRCLIITLGTARAYRHKKSNLVVANCHKLPSGEFDHFLLDPKEIVESYTQLITSLDEFIPDIKIIFTVSPIRHWKDGAHNNQLSKSVLFTAIHKLMQGFSNISYFPAYEIVLDELRDYRFYSADMLHPSEQAIDYIWQRFTETYTTKVTRHILTEIDDILKAVRHRPYNPLSSSYQNFLTGLFEKIDALKSKHSFLNFNEEYALLKLKKQ